jgi:hypothetical protein
MSCEKETMKSISISNTDENADWIKWRANDVLDISKYLKSQNWIELARGVIAAHPDASIELDEYNVPVWPKKTNRKGQPYKGTGVIPEQVEQHRERWDKVEAALAYPVSTNEI